MRNPANHRAATGPAMDLVPTPVGTAGITWHRAPGPARAVVLLGHGTATGVEAADLRALATALPDHGISVALITQPYRMNRSRTGSDEASLDAAWKAVWPLAADLLPPVNTAPRRPMPTH